jgi:hypothetical protein
MKAAIDKEAKPTSELDMDIPGQNLSSLFSIDFLPSSMLRDV